MSSVLTVQANLKGNASSLVGAAKQGADALKRVEAAAAAAKRAGNGMETALQRVGYALGVGVRGVAQFGAAIGRMGARAVGIFVNMATKAAMVGAALTTALAGSALKAGLDRLMSIQDATVALTRMLGGAAEAAALTEKVLKVVQGTPFAFPMFAEATRQLVAFGVKADKIPGVLQAIADSAAASGEGAEAVGRITQAFANMAVTGKMNSDIIQSLGSAGVNALGILANHFGVTTAEAQAMVSEGMIPAEEAMDILVRGIEEGSHGIAGDFNALKGAAQDLGKTISGSLGNVKAAFARMGASWLKPFEKDFPDVLNKGVIPLLDKLGEKGGEIARKFADTGRLQKFTDWLEGVTRKVGPFIDGLMEMGKYLSPLSIVFEALKKVLPQVERPLRRAGEVIMRELVPALSDILVALVPLIPLIAELAPVFARGLVALAPAITGAIDLIVGVLTPLLDIVSRLPDPIIAFGIALLGLQGMGVPVVGMIGEIVSAFMGLGSTGAEAALGGIGGAAEGAVGKLGGLTGFLTGPWGLAIAGAIGTLALFWNDLDGPATASVENLTDALDRQTGAITDNVKATLLKTLTDAGWISKGKEWGLTAETMINAALGQVDAVNAVNSAVREAERENANWVDSGKGVNQDLWDKATGLKELSAVLTANSGKVAESREAWADAAAVYGTHAANATALREAIDNATVAVDANGVAFDLNSEAGEGNRLTLERVNDAANILFTGMQNAKVGTDEMRTAMYDSIPALLDTYEKMGMARDEAIDLASKVTGIPESKVIQVDAFTEAAGSRLDGIISRLNSITDRSVTITTYEERISKIGGFADGGTLGRFADGGFTGRVTAAANGLARQPMMVRGGANGAGILWGEPETGWEAYISGKKSMTQRNRRIWADAGEKLGMFEGMSGGGGSPVYITVEGARYPDMNALAEAVAAKLRFRS